MPATPAFQPLCDPLTGVCQLPDLPAMPEATPAASTLKVHYVGDPMCSWCWGLSPALKALQAHCQAHGIPFEIVLGGLRAGGGDAWNAAFRQFLRQEWTHIRAVTGQPFSLKLLERAHFDYDTEPACRAIVTARAIAEENAMAPTTAMEFLAAVQQRFYVHGDDPKQVEFYRAPCATVGLPFDTFAAAFDSDDMARRTAAEFTRCREMGVRAFPSVLLEIDGTFTTLARGHATEQQLIQRLDQAVAGRPVASYAATSL